MAILYAPTIFFYFAGGDDFREIARARFLDARRPAAILFSPHDRNRFRPLDRLATLVTDQVSNGDPIGFRLRNVVFHIATALLVGLAAGRLLRNPSAGPIAAFLFGAFPSNALVVGLAVTTKTLFGLCFLATCLVWLAIWRENHLSVRAGILVAVLTVATLGLHEQGVGLILVSVLVPVCLWIRGGRREPRWLLYACGLVSVETAVVVLGRSLAGVIATAPILNSPEALARNSLYAAASLAGPIDFLALLGPFAVRRQAGANSAISGVQLLGAAVWLLAAVLMTAMLIAGVRSRLKDERRWFRRLLAGIMGGLLLLLAPAVLVTKYSEVYNYIPSALMITLVVAVLTRSSDEAPTAWVRRYGGTVLIMLGASYAVCSANRNWLLWRVTRETRAVLAGIRAVVPAPAPGALFLLGNEPRIQQGYSVYGLRGVGTLRAFGATPALQLLYGRTDLSGRLVDSEDRERVQPDEFGGRAAYRLVWQNGSIRRATSPESARSSPMEGLP